jgi:hypothetical protein
MVIWFWKGVVLGDFEQFLEIALKGINLVFANITKCTYLYRKVYSTENSIFTTTLTFL